MSTESPHDLERNLRNVLHNVARHTTIGGPTPLPSYAPARARASRSRVGIAAAAVTVAALGGASAVGVTLARGGGDTTAASYAQAGPSTTQRAPRANPLAFLAGGRCTAGAETLPPNLSDAARAQIQARLDELCKSLAGLADCKIDTAQAEALVGPLLGDLQSMLAEFGWVKGQLSALADDPALQAQIERWIAAVASGQAPPSLDTVDPALRAKLEALTERLSTQFEALHNSAQAQALVERLKGLERDPRAKELLAQLEQCLPR